MTRLPHSKKRRKKHWPFLLNAYAHLFWRRCLVFLRGLFFRQANTASSESRLQRRLNRSLSRNRLFFELVRRRRSRHENRPSRLGERLRVQRIMRRRWQRTIALVGSLGVIATGWGGLFVSEQVTLGGVPYRIVRKFWRDKTARDAYFVGDRQALHDQLRALGVEGDIKDYYRDRFDNEHELDRHIHQIMFDRTGYVGEAYDVDNYGRLNSRSY